MSLPEEWTAFTIAAVAAVLAAVIITLAVTIPIRLIARRAGWHARSIGSIRRPFRVLILTTGLWIAVAAFWPASAEEAEPAVVHVLRVAVIASGGWLAAGIVSFLFARTLARHPIDVDDNRVARRITTQVAILRRVATVVIAIVTVGAVLFTFDGVQAAGASLLASAGVVSVVAGIAAQSALSNVFAGLQLAFSDAIRVDDVVIADGEWGRIEEITLTYIVVRVWDDRRVILPSTYFTSRPFENWTRNGSELLGSVEFDVDWRVSPQQMREQLQRVVADEPLWDGRTASLQITGATGGFVRVRVLVTAANAGALWDLRCAVREKLVEWMHAKSPAGLPRQRVQLVEAERRASGKGSSADGLFSGSPEAEERGRGFQAQPHDREDAR
ncbi:MAG TPA: mechanosensitive ion channel family protein [Pseudolysinimonas sp.]|nr:mechanosensitive ion channel family protein [Pseudolysinimonas sp.]